MHISLMTRKVHYFTKKIYTIANIIITFQDMLLNDKYREKILQQKNYYTPSSFGCWKNYEKSLSCVS